MTSPGIDAELFAQQLGTGGIDNLVTNAERICTYEQQRIELENFAPIVSLQGRFNVLTAEEHRIEALLLMGPPAGDLRRLRRRAIYYWSLTTVLTISGFFLTLHSFAPFRLGWMSWVYSCGISMLMPFLIEHLLDGRNMEKIIKTLTAIAAIAGLASLMLFAAIRGNLLAQQIHQDETPVVILDDAPPQPEPQNDFYQSTTGLLRMALLLLAFTMEVGAGLALREAWRSASDNSQDWNKLRAELGWVRQRMIEAAHQATMLRNEPGIFANRFWRDFYRALLTNAARSAMTKLSLFIILLSALAVCTANAQDHLTMVVAIDLTRSVSGIGPDGESDFQKNIEGVTRVLSQVPASTQVTVIGITDHSFAQPYILLSAHVPENTGYFGERLTAARSQIVAAWKQKAKQLDTHFRKTDILGMFHLADQIFAQQPNNSRKTLIIFSDMRQCTSELNLETRQVVPSFSLQDDRFEPLPDFHGVEVYALGADGAGKSSAYWQSLQLFWRSYLTATGATVPAYSVLRELP
jgi:hypothetical protein